MPASDDPARPTHSLTSTATLDLTSTLDPLAASPAASPEVLARARLARELAAVPPEGTPAFWAHVRATGEDAPSLGALVVLLRRARSRGAEGTARDLFTILLERVAGACLAWAARVVARTPGLAGATGYTLREDLCQELTLYLWERIACGDDPAWERYFRRSLDYAQRHVAARYMERTGYWVRPGIRQPKRGTADPLTAALAEELAHDATGASHGTDSLASAEFADLRALVLALPARERVAVVLRYWQQADEREIAAALGGVTTRTVRNILRRALPRLRAAYLAGDTTDPTAHAEARAAGDTVSANHERSLPR